MSRDATPLQSNATGDLTGFTIAQESYLAYQAGVRIGAQPVSAAGALTKTSTSAVVGTLTDTFYNEPVGTHPETAISTGSTNYNVYQVQGSSDETGSDRRGMIYYDFGNGRIKEMNTTEMTVLCNRLLKTVLSEEYPGTYRLASSSPGADYATSVSNVFTDTRTDGTNVVYNLYKIGRAHV